MSLGSVAESTEQGACVGSPEKVAQAQARRDQELAEVRLASLWPAQMVRNGVGFAQA